MKKIFFIYLIFFNLIKSAQQTDINNFNFKKELSCLIEKSYKENGLQKTFDLLNALKQKAQNDPELTTDINSIIDKLNLKMSINESIIFPQDLSEHVLDYIDPNIYDEFYTFNILKKEISTLAWSPDGQNLAITYAQDKAIYILNIKTNQVKELVGHTKKVQEIAWSHDSQKLASNAEFTVRIWDINSGKNLCAFGKDVHSRAVSCLAFSPDGKYLATGDWNGKILLWNANTFKKLECLRFEEHTWMRQICWSPDSSVLAFINFYYHDEIRFYNINDKQIAV